MNDDQISEYLDYWMENEPSFHAILSSNDYAVVDVEHYSDRGIPRTAVSLDQNLILLFPPFNPKFDYKNAK